MIAVFEIGSIKFCANWIRGANGNHSPGDFPVVFVVMFVNPSVKWYSTIWKKMEPARLLRVSISCDDAMTSVWQEF
jgi:hypothetical protein